jgi:hypothetical protein
MLAPDSGVSGYAKYYAMKKMEVDMGTNLPSGEKKTKKGL